MIPRPYLSIALILITVFSITFFKIEVRRLGYVVVKLGRAERFERDRRRELEIELTSHRRPEAVRELAEGRLGLRPPSRGQIITMTDAGVVLEH